MNPFKDVANFDHQLCIIDPTLGDKIDYQSPDIKHLAKTLIKEEYPEVMDAFTEGTKAQLMKELADLIYVCVQAMLRLAVPKGRYDTALNISMNVWSAVHNSNQSKLGVDAEVRPDGKLLKSDSYVPPDLSFVREGF